MADVGRFRRHDHPLANGSKQLVFAFDLPLVLRQKLPLTLTSQGHINAGRKYTDTPKIADGT